MITAFQTGPFGEFCDFYNINLTCHSSYGQIVQWKQFSIKTDVDMRRRTRAGTHHEKTPGESSTDKQQCENCGRWFMNLSSHRKCNGRTASHVAVLNASQPDGSSTSRIKSQIGTTRKYALQQKALQSYDKILQVSGILITVTKVITKNNNEISGFS